MGHFLALENTMNHQTQEMQVVDAMRQEGGFATLRRLNEIVDFSTWKTKTPEATIRRIVQESSHFFRIQPGLWALNESREILLQSFELVPGNIQSEEQFGGCSFLCLWLFIIYCIQNRLSCHFAKFSTI